MQNRQPTGKPKSTHKIKRGDDAPLPPPEPRRERRPLSHVGGKVRCSGPETALYPTLEWALDVNSDSGSVRDHVHGFHSYPARLHPVTARRLIEKLSQPGSRVLDPFCGSGTVLVEAQLQGRTAIGVDLNPLAAELARFKTTPSTDEDRAAWWDAAERVGQIAEDRRQARSGPTRMYEPHERAPYDPHILFELDGLSSAIAKEPEPLRRVLKLVLSSILTKVSKSLGDSSGRLGPRRLASGFAIRTFLNKAEEVCRQCEEYSEALPQHEKSRVVLADARKLTAIGSQSIDLVVSSPPYPGVFDYLSHHSSRLHWLGLDAHQLAKNEIGSRRQLNRLKPAEAFEQWKRDFAAVLRALASVLKPGAPAALVIADSALGNLPVLVADVVAELAPKAGFVIAAIGSQERPHFHEPTRRAFKGLPRREHLIVLRSTLLQIARPKNPQKPADRRPAQENRRPAPQRDRRPEHPKDRRPAPRTPPPTQHGKKR